MKKYIILIAILNISSIYSKSLNLNQIIDIFKKKSNIYELQKISDEKLNIEKTSLFFKKYLDLKFSGNYIYADVSNNDAKSCDLKLDYKDIYLRLKKNNTDDKELISVGVSKSLNNLYFSEEKYKKNILDLKNNVNLEGKKYKLNLEIVKLIDDYVNIQNSYLNIQLKKELYEDFQKELNILQEKIMIGESVKFEMDLMKEEMFFLENEILQLEKENLMTKISMFNKLNMIDENYELEGLKDIISLELVMNKYPVKEADTSVDIKKTEIKFLKRNNQNELKVFGDYDKETKNWQTGITLSANLLNYKGDIRIAEKELSELSIRKNETIRDIEKLEKSNILQLESIESAYYYNLNKYEIINKRFEKIKELYLNGYINFLDYVKEYKTLNELKYKKYKSQNDYFGFKEKISYF